MDDEEAEDGVAGAGGWWRFDDEGVTRMKASCAALRHAVLWQQEQRQAQQYRHYIISEETGIIQPMLECSL